MEWKGGERVTCEVVLSIPYPPPLSLVGDVFGAPNLFARFDFEHGMKRQRQPTDVQYTPCFFVFHGPAHAVGRSLVLQSFFFVCVPPARAPSVP